MYFSEATIGSSLVDEDEVCVNCIEVVLEKTAMYESAILPLHSR